MATYSISGTVSPNCLSGDGSGIVMANAPGFYFQGVINADGTYTIAGLTDVTTYRVQVTGAKFLTSLAYQNVPVNGSNVIGVNFTAASAPTVGMFIPVFVDSFQRTNESPLSDENRWHLPSGFIDTLQILDDVCCTTVTEEADGAATFIDTGNTIPNDQFCSVEIVRLTAFGDFFLYLRSTADVTTTYALFIFGDYQGTGTSFGVFAIDDGGGNSPYTWIGLQPHSFSNGDVITFAVAGQNSGVLYVFQNGICIWQGGISPNPDGVISSGTVGLQCDSINSPESSLDSGVINFISGKFSITSCSSTERLERVTKNWRQHALTCRKKN